MKNVYTKLSAYILFFGILLLASTPVVAQSPDAYFESFSANVFPAGWKTTTSDNNLKWEIVQGVNAMEEAVQSSSLTFIRTSGKKINNTNIWAFSSGVRLTKGKYRFKFYQRNIAAGNAGFRFILNTTQDYSGTGVVEFTTGTFPGRSEWIEISREIVVTTEATYYLGIGLTSITDGVNINIDQVRITPINQFYNKPGADLTLLSSWGDQKNGQGIEPMSFDFPDHIFHVTNPLKTTSLISSVLDILPIDLLAKWNVIGAKSKVVLGDGTTPIKMVFNGGKSLVGAIDVMDNATLIINSNQMPVFGELSAGSTVVFEKNVPDLVSGMEFGKVIFNTARKNKFANKVKIKGKLVLQDARLELGSNDIELGYGATIENGSANNYIVANGKGRVRKGIQAGEEVVLPMGNLKKDGKTTYNPVKIKLAEGATPDIFSVGIVEGIYGTYNNDVPDTTKVLSKNAVNRTWVVSEDVKGGSEVTLTFTWTSADVLPGFNPKNCHIKHYENGYWDEYIGAVAMQNTVAINDTTSITYYSVSRSGIKSFTPWQVASSSTDEQKDGGAVALPVELVNFTAKAKANSVELTWATASEKENDFFAVERSTDGKNFTVIGQVKGHGTSSALIDYSFTDNSPVSGASYYRLRQVDFDGKHEYSALRSVVSSQKSTSAIALNLYPNPAEATEVNVDVQGLLAGEAATLTIFDLTGKTMLQQTVQPQTQVVVPIRNLRAGAYLVTVTGQSQSKTQRLVVR